MRFGADIFTAYSLLGAILFVSSAGAISIRDISFVPVTRADSASIAFLQTGVEPIAQTRVSARHCPLARNSVRTILKNAIAAFNLQPDAVDKPERILVQALMWHYLYQLNERPGFLKADSQPHGPDMPAAGNRLTDENKAKVRYLIALKTSSAVEKEAECILNDVLGRFKQAAVDAPRG